MAGNKIIRKDKEVTEFIKSLTAGTEVLKKVAVLIEKLENEVDEPSEIVVTEHRYGFISGTCREVVSTTLQKRRDISDAIDSIVTHRIFGIPLFLGLMYIVFYLTFTVGDPIHGLD